MTNEITIKDIIGDGFTKIFEQYTIEKIYKGKDEYCRCGCGGKYYYKDKVSKRQFDTLFRNAHKALNNLEKYGDNKHMKRFEIYFNDSNEGFINIPIFNEFNSNYNQCYTIYFKI